MTQSHARLRGVVAIALVLILAAGCQSAPGQEAALVLRVRLANDISKLDPVEVFDPDSHYVAGSIHSHLVRYKPGTTELEPELARSWEVSSDGLTYTFKLRDDVQWQKSYGKFTAADVKYSIERHRDPSTRSLFKTYYDILDRVEAVDDATVRMVLKSPFSPFVGSTLAFRSGWIVNEKAIKDAGGDYLHHPVGTGPYVFDHWTPGKEVVLTANDKYFEGAPKIKQLTFVPIPDDTAAELALNNGELDLAYFNNVESYTRLKGNSKLATEDRLGLTVHAIMLNTHRKPFDDLRVRQAMAYAIDRDGIVKTVWKGLARVPTGFISPNYFGYTDQVTQYPFDPGKAKELLAAAGLGGGFKTSLLYSSGPPWTQLAPVIHENLASVGIDTELRQMEFAAYQVPRRAGDYDLIAISTSRPADPDLILTEYFHSSSFPPGVNNSYYDKIDDLIVKGRVTSDQEQRKTIYADIQRQMANDVPVINVDWSPVMMVRQPRVQGHALVLNYDLNPQTMSLSK